MRRLGVMERYRDYMDLPAEVEPVSLQEGSTPLIPVPKLAETLGKNLQLFVKFEGLNPTGSFKDRGMTAAVSQAKWAGSNAVMCASTGNTAASAAAYAARAGMKCYVVIPEGKVAMGKLAGAAAYGAEIIQIKGSFDDALAMVVEICEEFGIGLVNSLNPFRLEGQKSAAFEICEELEKAPDWLCLPVGNAGNITAYWMGFKQFNMEKGTSLPRILGVQASGSAPLVLGHPVENPETIATAIRIGKPARGEQALEAIEESGGIITCVSDEEILEMQKILASEGIWVEPASVAGLAGLKRKVLEGDIRVDGMTIAAVCTGHGMKDPDIVVGSMPKPVLIPAERDALADVLRGE